MFELYNMVKSKKNNEQLLIYYSIMYNVYIYYIKQVYCVYIILFSSNI